MVKLSYITDIIEKCLTLARIGEKLSAYSQDEKDMLVNKLTNPFEFEEYLYQTERLETLKDTLKRYQNRKEQDDFAKRKIKRLETDIGETEDKIFQYERRIIQGYTPPNNKVPKVDMDSYIDDNDYYGDENSDFENRQIEAQEKLSYTYHQKESLGEWFSEGHVMINSSIYNNKYWNSLNDEEKQVEQEHLTPMKRNITQMINKTPGLIENGILYHGSGHFDVTKVVGDRIDFKGYISTSFKKRIAEDFSDMDSSKYIQPFLYKFLTPKGTKGICGESRELYNIARGEHEYLLGRNTSGTILNIDYKTREITVLLDG